ncbi:YhjD/YihY/BrkB family envelope integrity protein [Streptomyces sp. H10-C2]|uniref:YhjD/YihY/BrkB family envelope integrity protein n=1 Tax=unclassified Streptomyces TaxID=2593676 RepID=UPI0024B87D66|nr:MULTISPECIES: YhjD/YihY/BrkB family envelope integrity protein [unclassified Streptomyces]MDJ0343540.1 YhjD/YihY/BrkB family envelope integrity protein [Streptomyces sp. PH10-H1]MDJ0368884.1 YhjD/YihY/BrkB family envelope integrity protein [Streptomyces sp. H10-C2]
MARRIWQRGVEIELLHRSMGFAALGLVTLIPLLIVVAAALGQNNGQGFVTWVRDALGVTGNSARAVETLFSTPASVLSTTTALSLASLAVFGLSFVAAIQTAYERIWDLPSAPWHATWRRALALAVLVAYLLVAEYSDHVLQGTALQPTISFVVTGGGGMAFFWWLQSFLLCGRVPRSFLLPGAVATVLGLVGLRFFSVTVFSPLIASSAVSYGPIGTVLIVQSWLIGVGFVIYAGALAGQGLRDRKHSS